MVDRAAGTKQIFDAFVAGDVGHDRAGTQRGGDRIQAVGVAGRNDDFGALARRQFGG